MAIEDESFENCHTVRNQYFSHCARPVWSTRFKPYNKQFAYTPIQCYCQQCPAEECQAGRILCNGKMTHQLSRVSSALVSLVLPYRGEKSHVGGTLGLIGLFLLGCLCPA